MSAIDGAGRGGRSEAAGAAAEIPPAAQADGARSAADLPDPPQLERDVRFMERGMIAWRRADGELFVGGPSQSDPKQGRIGDCYFVATMSALAQRAPDRIRDIIRENQDGSFTVSLYKKGEDGKLAKKEVRVDRDLVERKDGEALYASSHDRGELWPSILEKAYAELSGGYDPIGYGGFASDALEALTGRPAVQDACGDRTPAEELVRRLCAVAHKDPTEMLRSMEKRTDNFETTWSFLKDASAKGDPVIAATYPEGDIVGDGLMPMHAYTVLGVEERGGNRFVKLRNPAPLTAELKDPELAKEAAAIPELKAFMDLIAAKGIEPEDFQYGEFEIPFETFRRSFHTAYRAPL
jgi:hypothetical protein